MTRRIAITGASRGIGLGIAKQLIAAGDEVYASCRTPSGADELNAAGPAAIIQCDVGDDASIEGFASELGSKVDGLDILINNAGITSRDLGVDRSAQNPLQTTRDVVIGQIDVNALGSMMTTQALRPLLGAGNDPLVLNISSQLGSMVVGAKMPFDLGYNASKSVVNMMTVMSATADPDVTYVAIHPGWVQSDMGGERAAIPVEESAVGIVTVLNGLTSADSGRFVTWEGNDHPW